MKPPFQQVRPRLYSKFEPVASSDVQRREFVYQVRMAKGNARLDASKTRLDAAIQVPALN